MSWSVEGVAVAIGLIATAVATNMVMLARAYAQVRDIVEGLNRSGVAVRGARGSKGSGGGAYLVGGGQQTGSQHPLLALESVSQRSGVTVTAAPAPTGPWDCGPACVVSEIEAVKGCWSADELLRLRYFGAVDARLTTPTDLVGMLRANGISAHERYVDAATARTEIVRNWEAGRSSIVLGDWVSPGVGHWMRFRGDDGQAEFMDPWAGGPRSLPWDVFSEHYAGAYVHLDGEVSGLAAA